MRIFALIMCFFWCILPASALEIEAPQVPQSAEKWMPDDTSSLWEGLSEQLEKVFDSVHGDIREASQVCIGIMAAALLVSLLETVSSDVKRISETAGVICVASLLLLHTNSMIRLASDTVVKIGEYGKLLLPVMTAALAAQGGIGTSAALYAGTALFTAVLQSVMGNLLVPGIYLYLALAVGNGATGENMLKNAADALKGFLTWFLKIHLMVFTTHLGLSGVISGTTDAAALKAAKVTMSSFVPVVGGVLSDASEAVLVSAGLVKNAAGIYGILAIAALFLRPFVQIAVHYLILKLTGIFCSIISGNRIGNVIQTFTGALGLLLGMTGAECIMVLISTVCFMRGTG